MRNTIEEIVTRIQQGEDAREQLLDELRGLRWKLASRYAGIAGMLGGSVGMDDLQQMACIGILRAAETYRSGEGMGFLGWAAMYIKGEIRRGLGINRGDAPPAVLSLDAPIDEEGSLSLADTLEAESWETYPEQRYLKGEVGEEVRAAVERLPEEQRAAVLHTDAAAGAKLHARNREAAFRKLRADKRLRQLWREYEGLACGHHIGVASFLSSRISETEAAVFRREEWAERNREAAAIADLRRQLDEMRARRCGMYPR